MQKVFRTHAWNKTDGLYWMSMEETLKMLKNLRLFPVKELNNFIGYGNLLRTQADFIAKWLRFWEQ